MNIQKLSSAIYLCFALLTPAVYAEVPSVDTLDVVPPNYHKAATNLATGGAPDAAALAELKAAGVEYYIDLRTEREGIKETEAMIRDAGLKYYSLPLGRGEPSEQLLSRFDEIMAHHADDDHFLFCASGNRAGTVWTNYLIRQGVPKDEAVRQGIDAGMAKNRAAWFDEKDQ